MIETMQKRINEIKQQDRKSYYEIANEIGISESTLYNLMTRDKLFTPAEQKIIAYLKGYLTKDEKLEAYRMDNEELKAENEKLKAQLDVLEEDNKKLSSENDALYNNSLQEVKEDLVKRVWNLQTENKELAHYLACMTEQRNKANTYLQEINEIAENREIFCENCSFCCDEFTCDDCGYVKILQIITKAEEE